MKRFITRVVLFSLMMLVLWAGLIGATSLLAGHLFDYSLSPDKSVLIVGNSAPECAINDNIVVDTVNMSDSGTSYFYSYLKVREILDRNQQIQTVVVGYSYRDITGLREKWFDDEEYLKFKLRNYFFLFEPNDYFELLSANPVDVLVHTPQVIFHNLKTLLKGYSALGRYHPIDANKVVPMEPLSRPLEYSRYAPIYLKKIYDYCQKKGVRVILLAVPKHRLSYEVHRDLEPRLLDLAETVMPEALFINHSHFELPDEGYSDAGHLNSIGARIYSEYLKSEETFKLQKP